MNVTELIDLLRDMPPDAEVVVEVEAALGGYHGIDCILAPCGDADRVECAVSINLSEAIFE